MKLLMRERGRSIEQRAPGAEEPSQGRVVEKVADCPCHASALKDEDNGLLGKKNAVPFEARAGEIVLRPFREDASCLLVGVWSERGDNGHSLRVLACARGAHHHATYNPQQRHMCRVPRLRRELCLRHSYG